MKNPDAAGCLGRRVAGGEGVFRFMFQRGLTSGLKHEAFQTSSPLRPACLLPIHPTRARRESTALRPWNWKKNSIFWYSTSAVTGFTPWPRAHPSHYQKLPKRPEKIPWLKTARPDCFGRLRHYSILSSHPCLRPPCLIEKRGISWKGIPCKLLWHSVFPDILNFKHWIRQCALGRNSHYWRGITAWCIFGFFIYWNEMDTGLGSVSRCSTGPMTTAEISFEQMKCSRMSVRIIRIIMCIDSFSCLKFQFFTRIFLFCLHRKSKDKEDSYG